MWYSYHTMLKDSELLNEWQEHALDSLQRGRKATQRDDATAAYKWTLNAGIATDKAMILAGRPTSIVASVHEVRHTLPQLAGRLAQIANQAGLVIDTTAQLVSETQMSHARE